MLKSTRIPFVFVLLFWISFQEVKAQSDSYLSIYFKNEFGESEQLNNAAVKISLSNGKTIVNPTELDRSGHLICKNCKINNDEVYVIEVKRYDPDKGDDVIFEVKSKLQFNQTIEIETESFAEILSKSEPGTTISADQILTTGYNTLDQALQYLLPSFFATPQTIGDGTDHITPISLKGLGPDQVLILINGKRRPVSPLINVNGTFGRGAVSNELSTIPIASIEEIQILKTAASVKYGSDAIAGIINIILKKESALAIGVQGGDYLISNGNKKWWETNENRNGREQEGKIWATTSSSIGQNGKLFLSGELTHLGAINRSGDYTGQIYTDTTTSTDLFWKNTGYKGRKVIEIGRSQIRQVAMQYNFDLPLNSDGNFKFYSFGGFSFKTGNSTGFYRFPKDDAKLVYNLTPYGYSPRILSRISETFFTAGLEFQTSLGKFDVSHSRGGSGFGFYVNNSINASLGNSSPRDFYAGGLEFHQNTSSVKWRTKPYKNLGRLSIESGLELRTEQFSIQEGDEASWYKGTEPQKEPGSQVFPGFTPESATNKIRENIGAYSVFNFAPEIKKWVLLISPGIRYETFSITKGATIGKIAVCLMDPTKKLNIHGSFNGGFRAPSLHQFFYSNTNTQFQSGSPLRVATVNNTNLIAKNFEIPTLKPEFSETYNIGTSLNLTKTPTKNEWKIDIDYTLVRVRDRIVLSGILNKTKIPDLASKFTGLDVDAAQFFNNYPDTRTSSIEINVRKELPLNLLFWTGFSYNRTTVTRDPSKLGSELLRKNELTFFNREEESRLTSIIPLWKAVAVLQRTISLKDSAKFTFPFRFAVTVFGENKYVYPDTAAYLYNNSGTNLLDVIYKNYKYPILDLEIGVNIKVKKGKINLSIGCNNLRGFKSNPVNKPNVSSLGDDNNPKIKEQKKRIIDTWTQSVSYNNQFNYSRRVQTFGVGGRMIYVKVRYIFK